MAKFNPYVAQIKFAQAVNDAIMHQVRFQIFRTIDGKVQKFDIDMMDVSLDSGDLNVLYKIGENIDPVFEKASQQDLMLISQRARQLEAARRK